MVATICPVGDGTRSVGNRTLDAVVFLLGCVGGGLIVGLSLASLGEFTVRPLMNDLSIAAVIAMVAALALALEVGGVKVELPALRRQVPATWRNLYGARLAAAGWGMQLGAGFLTYVTWPGFYVALVSTLFLGLPFGPVILALYALLRGLQPLYGLFISHGDPSGDFVERHGRSLPELRYVRSAALAATLAMPLLVVV